MTALSLCVAMAVSLAGCATDPREGGLPIGRPAETTVDVDFGSSTAPISITVDIVTAGSMSDITSSGVVTDSPVTDPQSIPYYVTYDISVPYGYTLYSGFPVRGTDSDDEVVRETHLTQPNVRDYQFPPCPAGQDTAGGEHCAVVVVPPGTELAAVQIGSLKWRVT